MAQGFGFRVEVVFYSLGRIRIHTKGAKDSEEEQVRAGEFHRDQGA
jgi:hypothetical protein